MHTNKRVEMVFASDYINKPKELSDFIDALFSLHENGFERYFNVKDFSGCLSWEIEEIGNWFFDKEIYDTSAKAYKELVLNGNTDIVERISEKIFSSARKITNEGIVDVLELICAIYQVPCAYASLAVISNKKKDYNNSIEYAKRALAVSNNDNRYNVVLGDCYFYQKEYLKAIDCYKKVLLSKISSKELAQYSNDRIKCCCEILDGLKERENKSGKRQIQKRGN